MHMEAIVSTTKKVQSSKIDRIESAHPGLVEEIGKRVKEIRESSADASLQDSFSKKLGLSVSKLNRVENARRAPDIDFLVRLKKEFDCDLNWMLTGQGDDYRETAETSKRKLLALLKTDSEFRQSVMTELGLIPASDVVRDNRVVDMLKAQRSDWSEIIRSTELAMKSETGEVKTQAEERIRRYREGVAYLDILLSIGRNS